MFVMSKAKKILLNPKTPDTLDVIYKGKMSTLTFHPNDGAITIKYKGCKSHGIIFKDWREISKVFEPLNRNEKISAKRRRSIRLTLKYIEAAKCADFDNAFIRSCLNAQKIKPPIKNGLSTGGTIEGKLITTYTIKKSAGEAYVLFCKAWDHAFQYRSEPFIFQNYTCVLSIEIDNLGMPHGVFIKELTKHNRCYKYYLINRDTFIGYSIEELNPEKPEVKTDEQFKESLNS